MKSGIYQFTHRDTGRIYIGSSKDVKKRKLEHKYSAGKLNLRFSKALGKYGVDAFDWEVLEYCNEELLLEREQYYLDTLQPFDDNGFNTLPTAGSLTNYSHTDDTIEKIRRSKVGWQPTDATREAMSRARKGKTWDEFYGKDKADLKRTQARKNWKHTEASKAKMKGRVVSTEARAAISKSRRKFVYEVDGVTYHTAKECGIANDTSMDMVLRRCVSKKDKWSTWKRIEK